MHKVTLSERFILSPKRVPANGRADYADALVPGLALRVSASGHRAFVLVARYPSHPKHPTRRALGDHGEITLEEAREKARAWIALIRKGVDPKIEEARRRAAEQRQQSNTFASAWGRFYEEHAGKLTKAKEAERAGAAFTKLWGIRPVTEIEPAEIAAAIARVAKRTPAEARNWFGHGRRFYSWMIGNGQFGVNTNPFAALRPRDLIGEKVARDRVLSEPEIRAIWKACADLGFPFGPLARLLILTGQRVREVADARWSEIDLDKETWTIPAARMKSDRAHLIPLAPDTLALLKALPHFTEGDFIFTTTAGLRPVSGFSKLKGRLDEKSGVAGWVLHDIRRTMRTGLSALPIEDRVREAMIAHAQPALHKTYDLYSWEAEKRNGFTLWEARLRGILAPKPPAGVADIEDERARRTA
ncbi:MAG: tyrosine-type recombinase/integrase [Stellaceae bacterium]